MTVRRGQGYALRVTAVPATHRRLLDLCQSLDGALGTTAVPAQRKARREYANRINALAGDTPVASHPGSRSSRDGLLAYLSCPNLSAPVELAPAPAPASTRIRRPAS
ncbi:hypothetical protein GCM10010252_01410 [Streptomyces aureoverticillatus]|nr:hypothetical protein GCM10010252_01410 [Streptomyces aureoverticillatus]